MGCCLDLRSCHRFFFPFGIVVLLLKAEDRVFLQLAQKEDLLSSLQCEKKDHLKELAKLRQELPRAERDRDQIQEEAEEIGREALRLSAEVEVLRRKVAQLEEDVMVKEGQISILRGSFGQSE